MVVDFDGDQALAAEPGFRGEAPGGADGAAIGGLVFSKYASGAGGDPLESFVPVTHGEP